MSPQDLAIDGYRLGVSHPSLGPAHADHSYIDREAPEDEPTAEAPDLHVHWYSLALAIRVREAMGLGTEQAKAIALAEAFDAGFAFIAKDLADGSPVHLRRVGAMRLAAPRTDWALRLIVDPELFATFARQQQEGGV